MLNDNGGFTSVALIHTTRWSHADQFTVAGWRALTQVAPPLMFRLRSMEPRPWTLFTLSSETPQRVLGGEKQLQSVSWSKVSQSAPVL